MKRIGSTLAIAAFLALTLDVLATEDAGPPLPSVATVLQRVTESSFKEDENDRAFHNRYAFTGIKVTEYRNSRGEVKKREEKKRENDPIQRARAAAKKASARKSSAAVTTNTDEAVSETHSNVRGKAFDKKDFIMNADLLKRFDFTVIGREFLNGRSALVVDFRPAKKNLPERNLKDRFINRAAGRVWVDEMEYALVKADLHLTERVNVVGGLVGAVWKFTFDFLRERTPDGFWFTRNSDWHLEGRELFIRRTVDFHEERHDVRRIF